MIDQSLLFQAKSFLCWDRFPELSIQLVPLQSVVGYFYPPQQDLASIVIFHDTSKRDVTEALCFLFHEVGHYLQWQSASEKEETKNFLKKLQLDKGKKKIEFETEAWELGEKIFAEFIARADELTETILNDFEKLKQNSLQTYFEEGV
ncbi:hypothetical protein B6D60_07605 [candidate division KSB1 bacterium 4484_87]|nr:MAG: hypothetical protein B6D60_07605 [candidate division KSB1 bacterium 4484_87]